MPRTYASCICQFQSTLSVRRATRPPTVLSYPALCISIHALRKESDGQYHGAVGGGVISIHALRKESDHPPGTYQARTIHFNPRSP